jgi:4-hydroxyphenylpyruvate dioxygenase-like putative hemolysin
MNHVVFAVAPQRLEAAAALFIDLGFQFESFDLADVGLHVKLDWSRGVELVSPIGDGPDNRNRVADFVARHGDGVYSVVIRVAETPTAEEVTQRYGATTHFRQHRDGPGYQLDEVEVSVLGFPLTFLASDLP